MYDRRDIQQGPGQSPMNRAHALSERGKPLHFAGRVRELALLDGRFATIRKTSDARAGMVLVTGVPGSGKTALCREFLDRTHGVDGATAVVGGVTDLDSAARLFLTIGLAIGREPEFKKIADVHTRTKGWQAQAGVPGTAGAGVGVDRDHVRMTGGFQDMLRRSASNGLWENKSLAILFDELQNVEPEQANTLRVLHEGAHGCPIMVIGAGLQHTGDVLSSCGISRVDEGVALGPLDRDATCEALAGALGELEIEPPTEIVERLADASHNFPQHVSCYLAAAGELVGAPVGWRDPATVDKVMREGDRRRASYYSKRLRAMGDGHPKMLPVIAHMRKLGATSMSKWQAEDVVSATGRVDGGEAVAAAIRHGVLTVDDGHGVSFGIPSFHNHMLGLLERDELEMRQAQDRNVANQHTR